MSISKLKTAGALLGLVMAVSPAVHAGQADPFQRQAVAQESSSMIMLAAISIESAISKAKAKYGGKVLSAKEIRSKGPLVYKIKLLLPNGRVKTVFVDGESGEVFEA